MLCVCVFVCAYIIIVFRLKHIYVYMKLNTQIENVKLTFCEVTSFYS